MSHPDTAQAIGAMQANAALFPPGTEELLTAFAVQEAQAKQGPPKTGFITDKPPVVEEQPTDEELKKNIIFRIVYFMGRQVAKVKNFISRHWRYVAELVFAAVLGTGVGIGLRLLIVYLFTISPVLAWGFITALIAQATVTLIAFAAKTYVERKRVAANSLLQQQTVVGAVASVPV